jgi:hypothetical protein
LDKTSSFSSLAQNVAQGSFPFLVLDKYTSVSIDLFDLFDCLAEARSSTTRLCEAGKTDVRTAAIL